MMIKRVIFIFPGSKLIKIMYGTSPCYAVL